VPRRSRLRAGDYRAGGEQRDGYDDRRGKPCGPQRCAQNATALARLSGALRSGVDAVFRDACESGASPGEDGFSRLATGSSRIGRRYGARMTRGRVSGDPSTPENVV